MQTRIPAVEGFRRFKGICFTTRLPPSLVAFGPAFDALEAEGSAPEKGTYCLKLPAERNMHGRAASSSLLWLYALRPFPRLSTLVFTPLPALLGFER